MRSKEFKDKTIKNSKKAGLSNYLGIALSLTVFIFLIKGMYGLVSDDLRAKNRYNESLENFKESLVRNKELEMEHLKFSDEKYIKEYLTATKLVANDGETLFIIPKAPSGDEISKISKEDILENAPEMAEYIKDDNGISVSSIKNGISEKFSLFIDIISKKFEK